MVRSSPLARCCDALLRAAERSGSQDEPRSLTVRVTVSLRAVYVPRCLLAHLRSSGLVWNLLTDDSAANTQYSSLNGFFSTAGGISAPLRTHPQSRTVTGELSHLTRHSSAGRKLKRPTQHDSIQDPVLYIARSAQHARDRLQLPYVHADHDADPTGLFRSAFGDIGVVLTI